MKREDWGKLFFELAKRQARGEKKRVAARRPEPRVPDEPAFAVVDSGYRYDSQGKRDPFRSFEWEQLKLELTDAGMRGPLEQFDVNQLTVVGVVWNNHNARALVQDPSGMSYIIGEGTRIGKNDGKVQRNRSGLHVCSCNAAFGRDHRSRRTTPWKASGGNLQFPARRHGQERSDRVDRNCRRPDERFG